MPGPRDWLRRRPKDGGRPIGSVLSLGQGRFCGNGIS
jgi:hypothetical protein